MGKVIDIKEIFLGKELEVLADVSHVLWVLTRLRNTYRISLSFRLCVTLLNFLVWLHHVVSLFIPLWF